MGIVPPAQGIEGEPRPASHPVVDLGVGGLYIGQGVIQPWMLPRRRLNYAKYGCCGSRYGRCIYGARAAIYGTDRYGSCSYY